MLRRHRMRLTRDGRQHPEPRNAVALPSDIAPKCDPVLLSSATSRPTQLIGTAPPTTRSSTTSRSTHKGNRPWMSKRNSWEVTQRGSFRFSGTTVRHSVTPSRTRQGRSCRGVASGVSWRQRVETGAASTSLSRHTETADRSPSAAPIGSYGTGGPTASTTRPRT
jgi:hypothetical protein